MTKFKKIIINFLIILLFLVNLVLIYDYWRFFSKEEGTVANMISPVSKLAHLEESLLAELDIKTIKEDASFTYSKNANHYLYLKEEGELNKLILDGKDLNISGQIKAVKFSPNSKRLAIVVREGNRDKVYLDSKSGDAYDWVYEPYFFSPDSNYFIYQARLAEDHFLVVNNKPSQAYDKIYDPIFNEEENSLVFLARRNSQLWRGEIKF